MKHILTGAVLVLAMNAQVQAAQLNQNSASIVQNISVPSMAVAINPGGAGCNTGAHEVWTPSEGGCSDSEYQKSTARVISVTPTASSIEAGTGTTGMQAVVITANGNRAPAGVAVKWSASNGNLTTPQTVTDGNGETANTLSGAASGTASVTASAAGGGAAANIVVKSSTPTITSVRSEAMNLHESHLQGPFRVYWTSPDQTPDTTIRLDFEWPAWADRYWAVEDPKRSQRTWFPDAGSKSWLINGSQANYKRVVYPSFEFYCSELSVRVTLCNGDACSSMSTHVKQNYSTDSM